MDDKTTQHYYGSTAFNWAVGQTRDEVLTKLAKQAGTDTIKRNVKHNGGLYAWVCLVHAPQSAAYEIEYYQPKGVEISDAQEFNILNSKGKSDRIYRMPKTQGK